MKVDLEEYEVSFLLECMLSRSLSRSDGKGIASDIAKKFEESPKKATENYCNDCINAVQNASVDANGNTVWKVFKCLADKDLNAENKTCKNCMNF